MLGVSTPVNQSQFAVDAVKLRVSILLELQVTTCWNGAYVLFCEVTKIVLDCILYLQMLLS